MDYSGTYGLSLLRRGMTYHGEHTAVERFEGKKRYKRV